MSAGASADPVLDRLKELHPKAIDLSLDRVARLLADLGHPEQKLAPVLHIAGTNGKGSTVASLRAIFEAAGYRSHVYTSPHLVRFNERIRLSGELIEEAALADLLQEIEAVNAGRPITFFEVTTAAAFLAFARTPADVVLLEVGMGGRLDATNLVERPLASVIAPIGMDHMQFLGSTLPEIAREKAGILKRDVPAVIGVQPDPALGELVTRAGAVQAPLFRREREWSITRSDDGFAYTGRRSFGELKPALIGPHQIDNAALAVAAIDRIDGFTVSDDHVRRGLATVEWPARLQRLKQGPLVDLLRPGAELYLDGGHNEAAADVLRDWAAALNEPLDLVFGMLSTKPPEAFLRILQPYVRKLRAIAIPDEALSLPADAIAQAARSAGIGDVAIAADVTVAVHDLAPNSNRILICGSLYLAGRILADNG